MTEQKLPIDNAVKSPGTVLFTAANSKFWKETLTNNDLLRMFARQGLGRKIVNKINRELFKKPFLTKNNRAETLRELFNLDPIASYAHKNAQISNFSLIYVGYPDVQSINDYRLPAPENSMPDYFFVITRAWIAEDIKNQGQKEKDFYKLYTDDGNTFQIHKSRIIRVKTTPEEKGVIEPAWNVLEVADNTLWSVGQALFRMAQGFPHITIKEPSTVQDGNELKSEVQVLKEKGVLRDINTESGFISDDRYDLQFKGAEGKALKPAEYWEVVLENLAMTVDIPKDVLRGVSAGAVTGSETNLDDYYSGLHSMQVQELQPIYDALFERLGITEKIDYNWPPIYEKSPEKQALQLKTDVEALSLAITSGIIDVAQAKKTLETRHPWVTTGLEATDMKSCAHLDRSYVKKQYSLSDKEIVDAVKKAQAEGSAQPKSVQRVEKRYMRDAGKAFRSSELAMENVFTAFNTDEGE